MFPGNHGFGFESNTIELYPRRRATEFYHEPQPLEQYQSRRSEHPQERLQNNKKQAEVKMDITRISAPRNSDMRMFRNSYFS